MSALDKLSMALGASTLEANFGLARINFDFSLYKVEAPKEYRDLGDVLTPKRREAAEVGTYHVTVRKLNALFEQVVPPTPRLISAYGLRSSSIARTTRDRTETSACKIPYRLFPEHSGIDGTNIWAAATSGEQAVALHLLACMLARLWPPSEATSIWVELVAQRKKRLQQGQQALSLACLAAVQVTISREHLAQWDAGARAWLSAADSAMEKRQIQLMLIVGNVDAPVNTKMDVYDSVLQAWTTSLQAVENILCGVPQTVQNGAVLLALSSWHLYPNLFVLGRTAPKMVDLADELMDPAGVLTLGLESVRESQGDGVYWSLPLAYLRYYGPSVVSRRNTGSHSSRISFGQFLQIVLGCALRDCGFQDCELSAAASLIDGLFRKLSDVDTGRPAKGRHRKTSWEFVPWLAPLAIAARKLLDARDAELESMTRLIAYGKRNCPQLFGNVPVPMGTVFGIGRLEIFLTLLDSRESAIFFIRKLAKRLGLLDERYIIRYKVSDNLFALASATNPRRWGSVVLGCDEEQETIAHASIEMIDSKPDNHESPHLVWYDPPPVFRQEVPPRLAHIAQRVVKDPKRPNGKKKKRKKSNSERLKIQHHIVLEHIFGVAKDVALYGPPDHIDISRFKFGPEDIIEALEQGRLDNDATKKYLVGDRFGDAFSDIRYSLRAVQSAAVIYEHLPDATVSIDITSHTLQKAKWVSRKGPQRLHVPEAVTLDLADTFACIACFETGRLDIEPQGLQNVVALSTGNSIYISRHLMCDPSDRLYPHEVRRIEGNIGKPGLALMIPPRNPMTKTLANDTWNVIAHADFDGKPENNFNMTSLHLSFTEYELPLDLGTHGARDHEAYFIESLVSIYDEGVWVADLDIMAALESPRLKLVEIKPELGDLAEFHERMGHIEQPIAKSDSTKLGFPATTIDSWNELLDPPQQTGVIRAHKNWLGRLAAATLSVQLGFTAYVMPIECEEACWRCVMAMLEREKPDIRCVIVC